MAKILLLGEIGVGKTSVARRQVLDEFQPNYKATIGSDVYQYEVLPSPVADPFHCAIWDTDGNFGDAIFRHVYARQADAAIIIGDVTRPATLEAAGQLGIGFMDAFPGRPLIYFANKVDLLESDIKPQLPETLHIDGVQVLWTSAKTGQHVGEAFQDLAAVIARRW